MIKAICFDFDGTLAQYQGDFEQLGFEVLTHLGLSKELFPRAFQEFINLDRSDGERELVDVLEQIQNNLQLAKSDSQHTAELMKEKYLSQMKILDGALETLELVKHLPLAIITNGISDMQRSAITSLGLEKYFKTIVVSADKGVGIRKPDKKIFDICASRLGYENTDILMIGNSADDISGAQNAGLLSISFDEKHGNGDYAKNHYQLQRILRKKFL